MFNLLFFELMTWTLKKYFIIICLLYFNAFAVKGEDTLACNKASVSYFYDINISDTNTQRLFKVDTLLRNIQKYNPLNKTYLFPASFGNIGMAHREMFYFLNNNSLGFDLGSHSFDGYLFQNKNVKYYNVHSPFTELCYVMGSKKEQVFKVIHTQNIKKNFNVGVDYEIINSLASYFRQKSDNSNVVFTSHYSDKNKKYSFIANYIHNRIISEENGGISNDKDFEDNTEKDRRLIDINLLSAENRIKESGFYIKQFYKLGNNNFLSDSLKGKAKDLGHLSYSFYYVKHTEVYEDNDPLSGFYVSYLDTVKTLDSIYVLKFENNLCWTTYKLKDEPGNKPVDFYLNIKHQYVKVLQISGKKYFNQIISGFGISTKDTKKISFKAFAEYVKGDYNDNDYKINGQIKKRFLKNTDKDKQLILKGLYLEQEPVWFSHYYYSNNFQWCYELKKTKTFYTGIEYKDNFFETGINYYNLGNLIYYDTTAYPKQADFSFGMLSAYLYNNCKLKNWNFDTKIAYQNVLDRDILRVPDFIATESIYFKHGFFKHALEMQTGIEIFFNSIYYADAYMPALRQFYLQNKKKTGNYIYADFFINCKIQRVRFFVKYQHFNADLMGYNYYMIPHYPMQDAAFKFGISWMFYD
jgi:hypothetical protein